jgi:MoxR-like ATPase
MNTAFEALIEQIGRVFYGKQEQVKLSLSCLLSGGHLLIEDLPGMGKTTLAHCLAKVLGLSYERVQFTSDLLPADVLGVSVFNQQTQNFEFRKGPVFTHLLLADEINRSTPKTQSALLEAMEEKQVSIDGMTRRLESPFFVIATQNPLSQAGTYPLPESQLDRFLMCISLGYPTAEAERTLLKGEDPRSLLDSLEPQMSVEQVVQTQKHVEAVDASDQLIDYIQRLVGFTRSDERFHTGLSPRGAMALLKSAKAWAYIHDRAYVMPQDVQAVLPSVVEHRVQGYSKPHIHGGDNSESLSHVLLQSVEVLSR